MAEYGPAEQPCQPVYLEFVRIMSDRKKSSRLVAAVSLMVMAVATLVVILSPPPEEVAPSELQAVLWPQPKSLQPFSLMDHQKRPFNLERLAGKWTFLFFGYTSCPDICPTTMGVLSAAVKILEQNPAVAAQMQVVFVSVDPQRDDLEHLADYMGYFNKNFIGVTGAVEEIDNLIRQAGGRYVKEPSDDPDNYLVSHASSIFLVGPEAAVYGTFPPPHDPGIIAAQYLKIRDL